MSNDWMKTGFGGLDDDMERQKRMSGLPRFWMPKNATKEVIFVDEACARVWEHQYWANGTFRNYAVCLKENGIAPRCPLCEKGLKPALVGFFTVISCDKWTDKQGREHKNELKAYPAKGDVLEMIKKRVVRMRDENKSLVGAKYAIGRGSSDTSASTGHDFDYVKHVDLSKEFPEAKAFDYAKYLVPMSMEEMEAIARYIKVKGGKSGDEDDSDYDGDRDAPPDYGPEDDVPF